MQKFYIQICSSVYYSIYKGKSVHVLVMKEYAGVEV
jgi:hypothetical protein